MTTPKIHSESPEGFEFIETPEASATTAAEPCGVRMTSVGCLVLLWWCCSWRLCSRPASGLECCYYQRDGYANDLPAVQYPAIKNAPVPADSPGSDGFSNVLLFSLIVLIPWYFARQLGGGFYTSIFFGIFTTIPILMAFWTIASSVSPRKTEKAKYAGRPVEHYLDFHKEHDRVAYRGKSKIPMEVFYEKYFNGEVDFKGDALECLEFRHDWANFRFTMGLYKHFLFGFIPELLVHSRSQGKLYSTSGKKKKKKKDTSV